MVVFTDGMLIYSNTPKDHTHHLRTVLETLRKRNLYAKLSKCDFWLGQMAFLGHVVSNERVPMDHQKIEPLRTRSFLGLARYYHRFV